MANSSWFLHCKCESGYIQTDHGIYCTRCAEILPTLVARDVRLCTQSYTLDGWLGDGAMLATAISLVTSYRPLLNCLTHAGQAELTVLIFLAMCLLAPVLSWMGLERHYPVVALGYAVTAKFLLITAIIAVVVGVPLAGLIWLMTSLKGCC